MKRSTFSLLLAAAILVVGGLALWFFLIAPRLGHPSKTGPATSTVEVPLAQKPRNAALNLYLAAPAALPTNVVRAELTLVKATVTDADGLEVAFFEGNQRVMLQTDIVEKTLSERIPAGHWNRLKLEFSPAAELAMKDESVEAVLLGKKTATFAFDAKVPTSGSLALFAALPLERETLAAGGATVANVSDKAQTAESFVFGGFLLDPRGRGNVYTLKNATLASVIKKDLGFDITLVKTGSSGFTPAAGQPSATPPPTR